MSQGRITCPRCGSNNFDTVTACWKCSAPLTAGVAAPVASAAQQRTVSPQPAYSPPVAQPAFAAPATDNLAYRAGVVVGGAVSTLGSTAASNRAAFWLGMLFPYFGLPIGLAFIMCDDRRRQEVGRLCVMWSLLSTALHILLMFVTFLGMRQMISAFLGAAASGAQRGAGGGFGGGGGGFE